MKNLNTKAPYESPEIKWVLFETESILDQSNGGFFGDEDPFTSRTIQVFNS